MMTLFFSPTSPYARKVLATVMEGSLEDRVETVAVNPFEMPEALVAANPLSKIPALVPEDGPALFDSPVICEYLDSLAGRGLFPADAEERWPALRLQAMADGIMDAAVGRRLELNKQDASPSNATVERLEAQIRRTLDVLEAEAGGFKPGTPSIGELALGCALGYLDLRWPESAWREGRDRLTAVYETLMARPSLADTAP